MSKMGAAPPPAPAANPYAPRGPQTPAQVLSQNAGPAIYRQDAQGQGTYGDVLKESHGEGSAGYQPDPRKYGVLSDTSVDSACPNCESPNYFSRRGGIRSGGKVPAPHCFDCGYNGEASYFQEAMTTGNVTGDAQKARGVNTGYVDFKNPIAHIKSV